MKIIREGTKPAEWFWTGTCRMCGCVIESDLYGGEVTDGGDPRDPNRPPSMVKCPMAFCVNSIVVHQDIRPKPKSPDRSDARVIIEEGAKFLCLAIVVIPATLLVLCYLYGTPLVLR